MAKLTEEIILKALSTVQDPSQGSDIVSLNLVTAIQIKDTNISFALQVPPHRGPAMEPVRRAAEQVALQIEGVTSATVMVTAHATNETVQAPEESPTLSHEKILESKVRRFVAVASGKGGVGKSTTAVNLAVALQLEGLRVGLLDADVYGPSQPRMLGVSGRPAAAGGDMVKPLENYGVKLMSMGLLVPDDTAMIWRGPMVQSALTQMLDAVAWGVLDVIIIDLPPGTGDIQLTLAQRVPLAGAVIVTTPQDIALLDARKGIEMFRKVEVPVLGIVENMSTHVCTHCGHEEPVFGAGGGESVAAQYDTVLLAQLPLTLALRAASDYGQPLPTAAPDSALSETFMALAQQVGERVSQTEQNAPVIRIFDD